MQRVLGDIGRQTGYGYLVDSAALAHAGRITGSFYHVSLSVVLDSCLSGKPLFYAIRGKIIHIRLSGLISGRVVDSGGQPVVSATLTAVDSPYFSAVASDSQGRFQLRLPSPRARLIVTCVGFERRELAVAAGQEDLLIRLPAFATPLAGIVIANGFDLIPAGRVTGSVDRIALSLLDRRVSPNLIDRLDGVSSGLLVNTNIQPGTNQSAISIRGRSTIFSDPDPLLVIDNFPYNGDINNVNPEDIESVTILKDAAAAALWGTRAANGVIVIQTKQGKYRQHPRLSLISSLTVGAKPNLHYIPILSSPDYISVEEYLFNQGYYDNGILSPEHPALSPVVEILLQQREGLLSPANAAAQLAVLSQQDTRRDLDRYWYRPSANQQYWLGLQGGTDNNHYSLSAGLDQDLAALVRNAYSRITVTGSNTYLLIPKKLEFSTSLAFAASTTTDDNTGSILVPYPYLKLADAQGNALAVPYQLRLGYADTAGGGQLLNWHYRPLDELRNADNVTKLTDWRLNVGLHYTILNGLQAQALYQYGQGSSDQQIYQSPQTYYTRNLINEFTQIDPVTGQLTYIVPLGGILNETLNTYQSHNGRLQIDYRHRFHSNHDLHTLLGSELQDVEGRINLSQLYGYNAATGNSQPVSSYTQLYPQYSEPGVLAQIPYQSNNTTTSDHYWSYYGYADYQYQQRFSFSLSGRTDQSNLFGVNINHKTIPLWSAGIAWELSREDFYPFHRLSFLRLRATDGYNGNVYKAVSAFTTLSVAPGISSTYLNTYGNSYADITNPPNPNLRWEQVHVLDAGLDFGSKDSTFSGSLDYYIKTGRYLIGATALDPTSGNTQFTANVANMIDHGLDLTLHTQTSLGPVHWTTDLLFSFVRDQVTRYLARPNNIQPFFNPATLNPLAGKPLYSIYALRWAGLDPQNGNPMGLLNGHTSEDYANLTASPDFSTLVYKGPVNPPVFGSWRTGFALGRWGLSALFVYKFGDFFVRPSIQYSNLFDGTSPGHPDFDRRWQQPGDELHTYVPSMIYPANAVRDNFYAVSEVLVQKGDLVRWQDLQFSYDLPKKAMPKLPVQTLRVFVYANHLGLLWTANHQHIDPDAQSSLPVPRSIALGIKMEW